MPSSSIRKKVCGLIRTTFSSISVADDDNGGVENSKDDDYVNNDKNVRCIRNNDTVKTAASNALLRNGCRDNNGCSPLTPTCSNSFITQCIFNRKNCMKYEMEIYSGKTGLDLPVLMLEPLSKNVCASYTGPEGGLTEVGSMRRQPIVRMANLDDELCLSFDGDLSVDIGDSVDNEYETQLHSHLRQSSSGLIGSCISLVDSLTAESATPLSDTNNYNWECFDEERCFGISTSLYERNPLTGVNAGSPIADAFGIIARDNNVVMALADGVNWGEGARLAARCAIRGAIDHLNCHLFAEECRTTTEVFHSLLGAFHSAHALILQEGGLLTTLCVAVAVQLKQIETWVLCVCNVGDSLCFVYNPQTGVREVTVASHDICSMRDMRDAGGALGPVDGTNPQLQNLTCSMTFVEPGKHTSLGFQQTNFYDVIFITSDGVSDNFDPVVGKFCVIKKSSGPDNIIEDCKTVAISVGGDEKNRDAEFARIRTCNASLPCVDAEQRHELMLLRMSDIISNGILPPSTSFRPFPLSDSLESTRVVVSASKLCHNLIQFAQQLSMAKRRTLEDPELYQIEKYLTRNEQRNHRKMVRCRLSEMPGKLDHATVVAFKVGIWPIDDDSICEVSLSADDNSDGSLTTLHCNNDESEDGVTISKLPMVGNVYEEVTLNLNFVVRNDFNAYAESFIVCNNNLETSVVNLNMDVNSVSSELMEVNKGRVNISRPCEGMPASMKSDDKVRRQHPRGSVGRHTLSVDVAWLKKFVALKNSTNATVNEEENKTKIPYPVETDRPQSLSLGQRLRSLMGSARSVIQTSVSATPNNELPPRSRFTKKISSANSSPRKKSQAY
ncbi:unnamed protein product [Thelazia callipaeda]|uniref:PPM-type phosphatase domain-containing protein n=1 Tax=Thelazia callipaeda TaxID=103827 RepID=A0A0N5CXD5_THECL|nr:unnamed protein product [Thelazia callipaeda]